MQVWTNSKPNGPIDQHEYNLVYGENSISLFSSNAKEWVYPNQEMATINDNGNGFDILLDEIEISLDYVQANQLLVLLAASKEESIKFVQTKTILSI